MNYKILISSLVSSSLLIALLLSFKTVDETNIIKSDFIKNLIPETVDDNLNYKSYDLIDYKTNKKINLSIYKNKILLLNFYEPWCPACNKEFYTLNEFAKNHKKDVEVISISSGDDMDMLNNWQKKWRYKNIKFYIDKSNKLTEHFKVNSIPATYLIRKDGTINYRFIGDRDYLSLSFSHFINLLLKK